MDDFKNIAKNIKTSIDNLKSNKNSEEKSKDKTNENSTDTSVTIIEDCCEDITAGENGDFWFNIELRKTHNKQSKIDKNYNGKTIVIVLESPHKDEFKDSNFISPALGTTGRMLQTYFTDENLNKLLGKEYLCNNYRVILMNSIQYQCSLGAPTEKYCDCIWFTTWYNEGKDSFTNRIKSYDPDIIINLSTKRKLTEEKVNIINQAINSSNTISQTDTICKIVSDEINNYIKTANKRVISYTGYHPSGWAPNFDSIHLS